MRIGDQEVRREDMPSFPLSQLNPSHIEQSMQDVLTRNIPAGQTPIQNGGAE